MSKVEIERNHAPLNEQAKAEYAAFLSARAKAIEDYNIMMGNLEDPTFEEDEEEE